MKVIYMIIALHKQILLEIKIIAALLSTKTHHNNNKAGKHMCNLLHIKHVSTKRKVSIKKNLSLQNKHLLCYHIT